MSKYYVVWVGQETGVFTDWPYVKIQVDGFPRAKYKSFKTREEAEAAYSGGHETYKLNTIRKNDKDGGKVKVLTAKAQEHADLVNTLGENIDVIYCDGVCEPNPGKAGSGISVYRAGQLSGLYYGLYNPNGTNNGAELNALYQALLVAKETNSDKKVQIFSDSKYAINCITEWAQDWKKNGWKKKAGQVKNLEVIRESHEIYEMIKNRVAISHVKTSVGIEGSELSDRMAAFSINQQSTSFCRYAGALDIQKILNF